MITRIQPANVTPPNVPPTEPVKSKISFKGGDEPDEFIKYDVVDEVDEPSGPSTAIHGDGADDIDDSTETWKENNKQFQEFQNSDNKFLKGVGKVGMLLTTGALAFGTAKYGLNKTIDMVSSMVAKDKALHNAFDKSKSFIMDKFMPAASKAATDVKNSKISGKISDTAKKAADNIKNTKFATYVGNKASEFAANEKVAGSIAFVKTNSSKFCDKVKGFGENIKSKLPTGAKVQEGIVNTIAVGSGFAGALTGADVVAEHKLEKQNEYRGAA